MMKASLVLALMFSSLGFAADPPQDWTRFTTPGTEHKQLAELAGRWNYTSKWWTAPNAKVQESKGKSVAKMMYGGRFLHEEVTGKMGKENFQGTSVTGFDSFKGEFQNTWADNMTTSMLYTTGTMENGTYKFSGLMSCPMTGEKDKKVRTELTIKDKNTHTFAMYSNGPDGKEFQNMEIVYTRAK